MTKVPEYLAKNNKGEWIKGYPVGTNPATMIELNEETGEQTVHTIALYTLSLVKEEK